MKSILIISRVIIKDRYLQVLDKKTNRIINFILLIGIITLAGACMVDIYSKLAVFNMCYMIPKVTIMGGNIFMIIVLMPLFLSSLYKCGYMKFFSIQPILPAYYLIGKMIAICIVPYIILIGMIEVLLVIYGVIEGLGIVNLIINSICIWIWGTLKFVVIGIVCIGIVKLVEKIKLIKQLRAVVQIISLVITIGILWGLRTMDLRCLLGEESKIGYILMSNGLLFRLYIEDTIGYKLMIIMGLCIMLVGAVLGLFFIGNRFELPDESVAKVRKRVGKYTYNQTNNLLLVCLKNNIRLLIREPVLFFQCIIKVVVTPIILIILLGVDIGDIQLTSWNSVILIFGIVYYESMINYVAATAISREQAIWKFNQTIPIPYKVQLYAKVILGTIINGTVVVGTAIYLSIMMKIGYIQSLFLIGSFIVICFEGSLNAVLMDFRNPIKAYTSEIQLIKANPNIANIVIVTMIRIMIGTIVIVQFRLNIMQSLGILLSLHILLLLKEMYYVKENVNQLYKRLEK